MKTIIIVFISVVHSFLYGQSLQPLFNRVDPSVVVIRTKEAVHQNGHYTGMENGLGSGVLISDSGDILTAAHVVQSVSDIVVEFVTGEQITADVIRVIKPADVALIQLRKLPKNIRPVVLADSDSVKVSDQVFIIGSPYGLEHSFSSGYISGRRLNDEKLSSFSGTEFFQTDAAINQGNSGGPMFNMDGQVIGIVSFILTESGGFQGLGFVATSNMAKKLLLDEMVPYIGIDARFVAAGLADVINVPQAGGLLIEKVADLSIADLAGLEGGQYTIEWEGKEIIVGGDVILAINGKSLTSQKTLTELRENLEFQGMVSTYQVMIFRDGEIQELELDLKNN